MNDNKNILRDRKGSLPEAGIGLQISFFAIITALCALCAIAPGLFGPFLTAVQGAFFAYILCSAKKPVFLIITPILCAALAFAISRDAYITASCLFFVPIGLSLAFCALTQKKLSVTVTALTVFCTIAFIAFFLISVTDIYGEGIKGSCKAFLDESKSLIYETFELFSYEGADGEIYSLSEDIIGKLYSQTVMMIPACLVLTCELTAYICAKLFRLLSVIFKNPDLISADCRRITLSAPAAIILLVSLFISFFSLDASVVSYAAVNLSYILIPGAAIAGFHDLFGRHGAFRRQKSTRGKIFIIGALAIGLMISPIYLTELLSIFGCIGAIGRPLHAFIEKKRNNSSDEQ